MAENPKIKKIKLSDTTYDLDIGYSNEKGSPENGGARYTVGGLPQGFDLSKEISVRQILDKIFFPFTSINVDTASVKMYDTADSRMLKDSSSNIPNYRTLKRVTLDITQNDTTGLNVYLEDVTSSTNPIILVSKEDVVLNSTKKASLQLEIPQEVREEIKTPHKYQIRYSYLLENGTRCQDQTIDLGKFGLTFVPPDAPGVTLKDSSGKAVETTYKVGQSCTIKKIEANVESLNSAVGDDGDHGINKFVLTKSEDANFQQEVVTNADKKSCEFTLTVGDTLAPTCETLTSGSKNYTYTVAGKYNARTESDPTWETKNESSTSQGSAKVTFEFEEAEVSLTGKDSQYNISKLNPINITANSLKATFKKNSEKITGVTLTASSDVDAYAATETITNLSLKSGNTVALNSTTYSTEENEQTFSYARSNICSDLTLTAQTVGTNDDRISNEIKFTFKAPYCWGWVDENTTTFDDVNLSTLELLYSQNPLYSQTSSISTIDIPAPATSSKFIFAIPYGNFKIAKNNNTNMDDFGQFENSGDVSKTKKTIKFADDSTVTYQILILASGTKGAINYSFS